MSPERARIDGRELEVRPGESILDAARSSGVEIPTLCDGPGLAPEGSCRLCLVEIGEAGRLAPACHTEMRAGLAVRTATPRLESLRRALLELYAGAHDFHDGMRGTPLDSLLERYGVEVEHAPRSAAVDASHPYLRFDPALCVTCRRCVRACESIEGRFIYSVSGRGAGAQLIYGASEVLAESGCSACGACVDQCPTGALSDRDRETHEHASRVRSVCGYCGVGCRVEVEVRGARVLRIRGVEDAAVNRGHLCAKGRYAHGWQSHPDRLTTPLVRQDGELRPISWQAALDLAAERLAGIRDAHGPDALGAFTSSRSTNEAAYLLQKLFRTRIGTNNVDCCARVCHSSTALALRTVTGTGAASASYADVERARCIVVAGANPTEAHPVVGARIRQSALRGTPLIVIDPRRIELAELADCHLQLRPGTNVALMNALAKLLLERDRFARDYVEARCEGLEGLRAFLDATPLDGLAAECDVPVGEIRAAAELLGRSGPVLFVHGLGLSELCQGTASVMALANLGMLTGSIGLPGAGMLPLRGQNNVQGNADMGGMPNLVTGYQPLDDPALRARLEREWGAAPPSGPGLTTIEMLDAALRGEIRALWVQGEDIAQSDPNQSHAIAALEALDFVIVQDLFPCETTRWADLVLPAAGVLEQEGTFTNGERRIQHVRPAVPPPGEARADWEVIQDVALRLGETRRHESPASVMDEVARVAPQLFGGVSYDRLGEDGLQWPCPSQDHPGTTSVHAEAFVRGKGMLTAIDYEASAEHGVEGYAYLLVTGRVRDHYNVGTMTRRSPQLELVGEDALEIDPGDARREGIADGDEVEIESRWGRARARARISGRIAPGTLFLPFHFPETHTNRLTGPHVDPQSHCPQYKATAVRVHPSR